MLAVRDLDLYYGDAQALDRVSLDVPRGAIVAIVGANGAGKSSLIRTIAGIEVPRSGSISFNLEPIAGLSSHLICDRGIGQVAAGRCDPAGLAVRLRRARVLEPSLRARERPHRHERHGRRTAAQLPRPAGVSGTLRMARFEWGLLGAMVLICGETAADDSAYN